VGGKELADTSFVPLRGESMAEISNVMLEIIDMMFDMIDMKVTKLSIWETFNDDAGESGLDLGADDAGGLWLVFLERLG
jgi:hypothetical protein